MPTVREFLLSQLDREVERSRKALEQMPEGQAEWKPHDKSMKFGYLAELVAIIPSWIAMQVDQDELDVAPATPKVERPPKTSRAEYLKALDDSASAARRSLTSTTDEHLATNWRLKARGQVVQEAPRHHMIQDTISHWSHHRGQMTVYLRLLNATVPAIFGPSADDKSFG